MKRIPKATYQSVEAIEIQIRGREADAAAIPAGPARQRILVEIAKLRAYCDVKRWLASPAS